tara:strand:+ start:177 stop:1046 length:870 start_codon:yes stop_codon:yes gene_type:complete
MADAAQEFLDKQLSKNKFTAKQQARLDASGGASVAGYGEGIIPGGEAYAKYDSGSGASGGGTERYADYTNSNKGQTAFTDTWQDGAKYQQLRGTGVLNNKEFDSKFASSQGGEATGTVADDGGGWKLIKQDPGEKSEERKLEYKELAAQWQAAGYDVRVQDHNPDFDGGTGEIAVRVGKAKSTEPENGRTPIEHSPEIKQATERVRSYEDNVMSGKTSENLFGDYYGDTGLNLNANDETATNKGETGVGTQGGADYSTDQATYSFLDSKKAKVKEANNIQPKEYAWSAD